MAAWRLHGVARQVAAASTSPWVGSELLPLYAYDGADVGCRYYHDHRYVAAVTGITWLYKFRKQEKERDVYSRVRREFPDLLGHECMRNEDKSRILPLLMSTKFVIAWSSVRWQMALMCGERAADEYRTQWSDVMRGIGRTCADTMQSGRCEGTPQINIADVDFTAGASAKINLLPWAATYLNLQDDWEFFAGQPSYALAPWEPEARIDMVWRFCLLRDRNLGPNQSCEALEDCVAEHDGLSC